MSSITNPLPVYWSSPVPAACQVCQTLFVDTMFDARVNGRWGNICAVCFRYYRCTLGTGRGQRYEKQPNGRWLKTGG